MSVQSQIDRINQNVANTYATLSDLGADMPEAQNSDNLAQTAGSVKAVLYSDQALTEDEKEQARLNIGASAYLLQRAVLPDTLTWDGDTTGKQVFDMMKDGQYLYYPITEKTVTLDELAKGVIIETADSAGENYTELYVNDFRKMANNVYASASVSNLLFVLADNATLYGSTIPKKGIYFLYSATYGYVSRIKILGYTGFTSHENVLKCKYLYFSDANKAEMVQAVLDALPTWQGGTY